MTVTRDNSNCFCLWSVCFTQNQTSRVADNVLNLSFGQSLCFLCELSRFTSDDADVHFALLRSHVIIRWQLEHKGCVFSNSCKINGLGSPFLIASLMLNFFLPCA